MCVIINKYNKSHNTDHSIFSKLCSVVYYQQKAMTLLEIIIVIALLGGLFVYLATNLTSQSDSAKEDQARLAMGQISQALQIYRIHNNRYPTSEQGLQALVSNPGGSSWRGPYIETNKLKDPWGNDFSYQSVGKEFKIISPGLDGIQGNEDDVFFPEDQGSDQQG